MSGGSSTLFHNRWLWWKEFRMLAPLVVLVLGVALLLLLTNEFLQQTLRALDGVSVQYPISPMILPSLFAAGAGAVLVGQEREHRTLQWMSSLPISPPRWILIKGWVALMGLAVIWIAAGLCNLWLETDSGISGSRWQITGIQGRVDAPLGYPVCMAHSVYLLLAGFYTAWRLKNQFAAVASLLMFAFFPMLLAALVRVVYETIRYGTMELTAFYMLVFLLTLLSIPVAAMCAYRAALHTLEPASAPAIRPQNEVWQKQQSRPAAFQLTSPVAAITWQAFQATPKVLVGLMVMAVVGFSLLLSGLGASDTSFFRGACIFAGGLFPLSITWLGVLVFQNDGASSKLKFLADRGVSPTKVYLARHAVPISMVAACLLMYLVYASWRISVADPGDGVTEIPSLLMMAMIGWVAYSIGQWTSQLFRALTMAMVASPAFVFMVLAWYIAAINVMHTPLWLIALCSIMPMLATWWVMGRFMEQRDRPRSFLVAIGMIVLNIFLPIKYAAWQASSGVMVSSADVAQWKLEGVQVRRSELETPIDLKTMLGAETLFLETDPGERVPIDRALKWMESRPESPQEWIPTLNDLSAGRRHSATIDYVWSLKQIHDRLAWERMKFESTHDWDSFSDWLVAAMEMAASLRAGISWQDQDAADVLEIWSVAALELPAVQAHLTSKEYRHAVGLLPSKTDRNQSRRRAVLASWSQEPVLENSGIKDHGLAWGSPYVVAGSVQQRRAAIVSVALMATKDQNDDWLKQMHRLQLPATPFQYGPYGPLLRQRPALEVISSKYYPSRYWGMAWEDDSQRLIDDAQVTQESQR